MNRMTRLAGIGAFLAFPVLFVGSAQALNFVSFVSLSGSGSACTFSSPCVSISSALAATEPSGQIRCLDNSYGTSQVIITKPITIDCEGLVFAAALGIAITINIDEATFPNAVVTLRNLTIDGVPENGVLPEAQFGIQFSGGGAALHIENCKILGFAQQGIEFAPTSSVDLFIRDTIVSNNAGGGILINPAASASVKASLDNVRVDRNGAFGLSVVKASGGIAAATLNDVQIQSSATFGVRAEGAGARTVLNASLITRNATGLSAVGGAIIFSFGNNALAGNSAAGTAPTVLKLQ